MSKFYNRRYIVAQDPEEEPDNPEEELPVEDDETTDLPNEVELVKEVESEPINHWGDFLQAILKEIRLQLGLPEDSIILRDPQVENVYGSSSLFDIVGYIHFVNGLPEDIQEEFGDVPVHFRATINKNKVIDPISVYTNPID